MGTPMNPDLLNILPKAIQYALIFGQFARSSSVSAVSTCSIRPKFPRFWRKNLRDGRKNVEIKCELVHEK